MVQYGCDAVDYIVLSEFDKFKGVTVKKQFPENIPLISNQMEYLIDLIMPLNLHKFLNTENYTLVPLFIDSESGLLSWEKDSNGYEPCYLFTISYFEENDSYRNGTAKSISLVSRLPLFEAFKPLMTFLLHELFAKKTQQERYDIVEQVFVGLRRLRFADLILHYAFSQPKRFVLSRLDDINIPLAAELNQFTQSGNVIKAFVEVGKVNFPIQLSALSLISSEKCMFGLNLQRDKILRNLVEFLDSVKIISLHELPYHDIKALNLLIYALLLKKKIIIYCHDLCYNKLMEIVEALLLVTGINIPCYPILDLGALPVLDTLDHYLIGTSNILFKEKVGWDLLLDLDSSELILKGADSSSSERDEDPFGDDSSSHSQSGGDRRSSVMSNAEYKLRQLFKRGSSSLSQVPTNVTQSTEDSFEYEKPQKTTPNSGHRTGQFPTMDRAKTEKFFYSSPAPNFFQIGFQFKPMLSSNWSEVPTVDADFNRELEVLIKGHHDDYSIYRAFSKYVYELKYVVFESFTNQLHMMCLKSYRSFAALKLEEDEYADYSMTSELHNYIKNHRIAQPLLIGHKYEPEAIIHSDYTISEHYSHVTMQNQQLHRIHKKYQEANLDVRPDNGAYYWLNNVCFKIDLNYIATLVSRLFERGTDCRLSKVQLLQLYKAINQLLKSEIPGAFEMLLSALLVKSGDLKSFEKLLIASSIYYRYEGGKENKDEVIIEFKRFLSLVLNHETFNSFLLPQLNDLIKLNVNDFIDYHM